MALRRPPLRVAVVQFSPKIGHVEENIAKARELCAKLEYRSVDLVCLPEMILTGYVFPDAASISPYLEEPRTGPTSRFCADLSKRLCCYVMAGYPERLKPDEVEMGVDSTGKDVQKVGANSAAIYGPDGEWVGDYRKTNLFNTDMTWAKAGTGFATFHLPEPLRTMTLGICMDLNVQPPHHWQLQEGPYEIADHCIETKSNVLVLLNAWLDSGNEPEESEDWQVLNFWSARLRPLWARKEGEDSVGEDEVIVIVCNRCGEENGVTFAGSSAMFSMKRGSGRPKLLQVMGRRQEDVQIWTV